MIFNLGDVMSKKIPISDIKALAKKHDLTHVILYAYDGENEHVVTYGKTIEQAQIAADFGNIFKKKLGWPEKLCHAQPIRVKKLQKQINSMRNCDNCKHQPYRNCLLSVQDSDGHCVDDSQWEWDGG